MKRFYQHRLPGYYRYVSISQILLILGSLTSALLAFVGKIEYTPLVAIGTSSITAWLEFRGTRKKISLHSATVDGLEQHLLWWTSLTSIEQASVSNLDRLVDNCEELLRSERNSWLSTSKASA